ncbi:MAG: TonB-dependent receptor [Pyrinomonadaceae bacterium]|nr:TonB-dependent receptor [Pyrinomonadaceae bacterium]
MVFRQIFLTFILLAFSFSVFAQTKEISGQVTDQNSDAVAGASVILRNKTTGLDRIIVTDVDGNFKFSSLSEGQFEVTIVAEGFQRVTKKVESNQINFKLEVTSVKAETTIYSGSRQEELREDLNTKVDVVTRQQIQDSGYETVGEVLKEIPGVITRRGSETGTSSGAEGEQNQGIGSRQSLVLIDGFPVTNARGIKSGNINLDRQSTARIEQVEVVKGAASALYGSDAIGGVVNLITRDPRKPFEFSASTSGGTFNSLSTNSTVGFKKKGLSGFISGERHKRNDFDLTPTVIDTTGAGFHRYDFFSKIKYQFSNNFYISSLADVKIGNSQGRSLGEAGFQRDDVDETNQSYGLTGSWSPNARTVAQVRGYFSRYDEIGRYTLLPSSRNPNEVRQPDENLFERFGRVDASMSYIWGEKMLIQFGGEWTTDRYRGINRLRNNTGERADTKVAWGQNKLFLTNWATLTVGLRYDNHSIFGDAYSPKVGLNIRATDRINLRASWGRGFRAPDLGQLYFRFFNPTNLYQVFGNPNLSPEHSGSWQVGAEYSSTKKDYRFGVNFFRNDVRNLIEARNFGFVRTQSQANGILASLGLNPAEYPIGLNRLLFVYQNLSNIYTQGVEVDFDIKLPKRFLFSGAYTYLDARDKLNDSYLPERNKHQGIVKLSYDNPELGFRANTRMSFYSSWTTSSITNRGLTEIINASPFQTVDVYAAKSLKKGFELYGTVENLFDVKDRNFNKIRPNSTEPFPIVRNDAGRLFRIGIRYSFSRGK